MNPADAMVLVRSLRALAMPQFRSSRPVRRAPAVARCFGAVALVTLPLLVPERSVAHCDDTDADDVQMLQQRTVSRALEWYTSTNAANYAKLNGYLRGGRSEPHRKMDRTAAELDELIDSAEPFSEDTRLYRGLDCSFHRSLSVGERIVEPAFMSTSQQRSTANFFALRNALCEEDLESVVVLDIIVPAGFKVLKVVDREEAIDGEEEVLLPRGTELEIVREKMRNGVKILRARVVADTSSDIDAGDPEQ